MPPWSKQLALAVRARRKELGLTQRGVADLAGCGPVFLYQLETGKPSLRLDKLLAVLQVLGLELHLRPGHGALSTEGGGRRMSRHLNELVVFQGSERVGRLRRTRSGSVFEYDEPFHEALGGRPVHAARAHWRGLCR